MYRLSRILSTTRGMSTAVCYLVTTVIVMGFVALRVVMLGQSTDLPFLLLVPSILLTGLFFNRGTGVYATFLVSGIAWWFFMEPLNSFKIPTGYDRKVLLAFMVFGVLVASILEVVHALLAQLNERQMRLEEANRHLSQVAAQKAIMLSEAVHRSRNDLQRLAALLLLQAGATKDTVGKKALRSASRRVATLARINERLDRHHDDLQMEVDSQQFLAGLVDDIRNAVTDLRPIALSVSAESHVLPLNMAVSIGLIVNELVGNALKYAFPGGMEGAIKVCFRSDAGQYVLTVRDDGAGFDPDSAPRGSGLGSKISQALARQHGGQITSTPSCPDSARIGVVWTVTFPDPNARIT
jgi:two-component system, sensor histidine kinase PdtaS